MERIRFNKIINELKNSPKVLVLAFCSLAIILIIGLTYALQNAKLERLSLMKYQLHTCGEKINRKNELAGKYAKLLPRYRSERSTDDAPDRVGNCLDAVLYGKIRLGTPEQELEVMFDTGSSDFWVTSDKCESKQCLAHSRYISESSSTYIKEGTSLRIDYGLGDMQATTSYDDITIGGLHVEKQKFGEAFLLPKVPFQFTSYGGVLGLGFKSQSEGCMTNPIQNMLDKGLLKESLFSFYLNSDQTQKPGGEIILGKVDLNLIEGDITYTELVDKDWWQIDFDSVSFVDGLHEKFSVCEGGCQAIIDTGTSLITAPTRYAVILNAKIGAKELEEGIFYLPSCDLSNFPNFEIRIRGRNFTMKPEQYVRKVENAKKEQMCVSGIVGMNLEPSHDGPLWIFGNMFAGHFYTVFDMGQKRIGFAETKK